MPLAHPVDFPDTWLRCDAVDSSLEAFVGFVLSHADANRVKNWAIASLVDSPTLPPLAKRAVLYGLALELGITESPGFDARWMIPPSSG
jgi:hypothetical protein